MSARYSGRHNGQRLALAATLGTVVALLASGCSSSSDSSPKSTSANVPGGSPTAATTGNTSTATTATSGSTSTATAATTGSTATAAPTGDPIRVGTVYTLSGSSTQTLNSRIVKVWEKWTNAHGGINGHPVAVNILDDAANPGVALTGVKKLVQSDKVQAIVGDASATSAAMGPYLQTADIAVIGGNMSLTSLAKSPHAYPVSPSVQAGFYALMDGAKAAGATNLGFFACSTTCGPVVGLLQASAKAAGLKFGYSTTLDEAAPSFAAPCLAAKQAGVDVLYVGEPGIVSKKVITDCAGQGFHPLYVGSSGAVSDSFKDVAAAQPFVVGHNAFPWTDRSTPARKAFGDAIAQYDPSIVKDVNYGGLTAQIWTSFELFKAAAIAGNIGPDSKTTDVIAAMYKLPPGDTLGSLTVPLTFVPDKPTAINCFFLSELKNNQWTLPFGQEPRCMPTR